MHCALVLKPCDVLLLHQLSIISPSLLKYLPGESKIKRDLIEKVKKFYFQSKVELGLIKLENLASRVTGVISIKLQQV